MKTETIALTLISHTNAGKTTLARTLLGRDVGEVRDAPHVTTEAQAWPLLASPEGDHLLLWDTPGFGDSARLAKRLAQQGQPIGWFLAEVWDRYRDRPFYLTQLAVRNVRDSADVVLYLVNAAEAPEDAGYLAPELAVLSWMDKPVIALLNQTGPPRPAADEAAEIERWRAALKPYPVVRAVLPLDAFARCWVQEFALLDTIDNVLYLSRRPAFARLATAWRALRWKQFDDAMVILAAPLALAVGARVALPQAPMMRRIGEAIGVARPEGESAQARALRALAQQLDEALRASMDQLITTYGLEGRAAAEVEARIASDVVTDGRIDEGKAAAMGGIVSGAVTGLAADLAAGGLTFGAGMLTGALLGALGGAGIARGVNVARGTTDDAVRWDDAFLHQLLTTLLLRYLAVAHYGRGRGEWQASEYPSFWRARVTAVLAVNRAAVDALWTLRATSVDDVQRREAARQLLADTARELLDDLYPPDSATSALSS
ncbi:MAG: DUF3482 domain-containing protein [Betaproteobacteria bacterium]